MKPRAAADGLVGTSGRPTRSLSGPLAALLGATVVAVLSGCSPAEDVDALPVGCDFGDSPSQDASMSCYEDLDTDGDGTLSRREIDRLPRTRDRFEELDADASGEVGPKEFQDGIRTLLQRAGGKGV